MIVQGVVKPAPGLDFASKPDVRLGVKLGHEAMSADFMSTRPEVSRPIWPRRAVSSEP